MEIIGSCIALGERLAWHQMTPYEVGGIYADSVEGVWRRS